MRAPPIPPTIPPAARYTTAQPPYPSPSPVLAGRHHLHVQPSFCTPTTTTGRKLVDEARPACCTDKTRTLGLEADARLRLARPICSVFREVPPTADPSCAPPRTSLDHATEPSRAPRCSLQAPPIHSTRTGARWLGWGMCLGLVKVVRMGSQDGDAPPCTSSVVLRNVTYVHLLVTLSPST